MPNKFAHFAIEAEDVERARTFYEDVFGWSFEPWGPPNFYLIHNAGVHGALQQRPGPLAEGRKGIQCSFAVADLGQAMDAVVRAGGAVDGQRHAIPTVGELVGFTDTEGNEATLIQYEPDALAELGL